MKISASTKVHNLLKQHPFLEDFLAAYNPKFEMLKNKMARATVGRVATLRTAAGLASIELGPFIEAIATEIEKQTGTRPETADEAAPAREERLQILKRIITDLHDGGDLEEAKRQFSEAVEDVEASEIAAMEEELIKGGLPVSEVQRLCDVHVGAFRQALDEHEGEDDLGYVLATPAADWPGSNHAVAAASSVADATRHGGLEGLMTGDISLEQLNLILTHLPVDLSFVDETDTVRFYSEGPERIFPRSPAVIGRKVQNCHPPKSVHMVQDILDSFRAGTQSLAEFCIELGGKFIHIRYFAIRDKENAYRGCLEVSQDVTGIRALEGERRLLEWEKQ